jgi:hypothetical protein
LLAHTVTRKIKPIHPHPPKEKSTTKKGKKKVLGPFPIQYGTLG